MAIERERKPWIVTGVKDRLEFWIRKDLNSAFSSCQENLFSTMAEDELICLDWLLVRSNWC